MKTYTVSAMVTISLTATVEADSEKEAIRLADDLSMPMLCNRCAGGDDGTWVLTEIDGAATNIHIEDGDSN